MANYTVTITDGQGSTEMKAGTYMVSATEAFGYDTTTLSPTSYTATETTGTGTFTLSASGTLTFNVVEDGTSTPITSGTIVMTDQTGSTQYGTIVNISSTGEAIFNNVPYGTDSTPFVLYFKQLTSDDNHNPYSGVITVSMTSATQSQNIVNTTIATQSITLTNADYDGLTIPNATLSFSQN